MTDVYDLVNLIEKGDVVSNVEGSNVEEIFKQVCNSVKLPEGITPDVLCDELIQREKVLSTAVGSGISIPHPRRPLLKKDTDRRIYVCYLKNPLDMQAPDARFVNVMFILLSESTQFHIQALAALAKLLRNDDFIKALRLRPGKNDLIQLIKQTKLN